VARTVLPRQQTPGARLSDTESEPE